MRTYLPFSDFAKCAACFDMKRLTRQRHDVMEIVYLLSGRQHPTRGDRFMYNSPPKKVWQHCPLALIEFGFALCDEYEKRTNKPDPIRERLAARKEWFRRRGGGQSRLVMPDFLKSEAMQNSHRAMLARQNPEHYSAFGFERDPDDEKIFYWPVEEAHDQFEGVRLSSDCEEYDDDCDCDACREARDNDSDSF